VYKMYTTEICHQMYFLFYSSTCKFRRDCIVHLVWCVCVFVQIGVNLSSEWMEMWRLSDRLLIKLKPGLTAHDSRHTHGTSGQVIQKNSYIIEDQDHHTRRVMCVNM